MNKRIRELAEQALFESDFDDEQNIKIAMDIFAELIVAECIERGNTLAKHYMDNHTERDQAMLLAAVADYSNEIKKHFGVEE